MRSSFLLVLYLGFFLFFSRHELVISDQELENRYEIIKNLKIL